MPDHRHLTPLGNKGNESKVEEAKKNSKHLRGTIAETLASDAKSFEHDDMQLLKHHGIYQQDDRDVRDANRAMGEGPDYSFMCRVKIPGGFITSEQYLALEKVAEELTTVGSLRVTTRQNIQFHGVLKGTLKAAIQTCNSVTMSSLCGCGDVERNIMAPPAPFTTPAHAAIRELATELSDNMCPRTNAYMEIWMDGEKVDTTLEQEPLYKEQYLPRKFKTAVGLPEDNSVDLHSQDVGMLAIVENDKIVGANIYVGGGLGMTHKKEETYARLGTELGYVERPHLIEALQIICAIYRDYGDRTDRKHARLKFIIEEQGIEAFRAEFRERASFILHDWKPTPALRYTDYLGVHDQGDGKKFYGIWIPNGRILDTASMRIKSALHMIVTKVKPRIIFTPNQNILLADLSDDDVKAIGKVLKAFGIKEAEQMTWVERGAMACPALPTCGLALTEAERVMGDVVHQIEKEFIAVGLQHEPLTIRMTGCPNGCARPYTADIGLVGHKPGHYDIFLGGSIHGHRMAELYAVNVPQEELPATLRPLLESWRDHRTTGESFSDYYERKWGNDRRRDIVTGDRDKAAIDRVR
jgi:sulfite reductase beta subunit-like hemoprotein